MSDLVSFPSTAITGIAPHDPRSRKILTFFAFFPLADLALCASAIFLRAV
jgi:hypothetical protein